MAAIRRAALLIASFIMTSGKNVTVDKYYLYNVILEWLPRTKINKN